MSRAIPVDELNTFSFEDYFKSMEISKEQKKARIRLAEAFLDAFLFVFAYAKRNNDLSQVAAKTKEEVVKVIPEKFKRDGVISDSYMKNYVALVSMSIAQTTFKYGDGYYTSYDRAFELAATEANNVENYGDFADALAQGKTMKTWETEEDERVRPTHMMVDGETIPIKEYFRVGNSYMRFPGDLSLSPSPGEVMNCRCVLIYK